MLTTNLPYACNAKRIVFVPCRVKDKPKKERETIRMVMTPDISLGREAALIDTTIEKNTEALIFSLKELLSDWCGVLSNKKTGATMSFGYNTGEFIYQKGAAEISTTAKRA